MYMLLNQNRAPFLPLYPQPIRPQDREDALQRRMRGDPIPDLKLEDMSSGISPELNALVLKACAYNRRERFTDPTAMRKALEAVAVTEGYDLDMAAFNLSQSADPQNRQDTHKGVQDVQNMHTPSGTKYIFTEAQASLFNVIREEPDAGEKPANRPDIVPEPDPEPEPEPDSADRESRVPPANTPKRKKPLPLFIGIAVVVMLAFIGALTYYLWGNLNNAQHGYGISVDGQTDIVLPGKKEAQNVLKELTAYYTRLTNADANAVLAAYEEEIEVVRINLSQRDPSQEIQIMNSQEALQALINGKPLTVNELTFTQPYLHVILQWSGEVTEEMDFETDTREDDTMPPDTTAIQQEGKTGIKLLSYNFVSRNGVIIESTLTEEKITKAPVDKIVFEGPKTSQPEGTPSESGSNNQPNTIEQAKIPALTNGWSGYELDFETPGYYCDGGRVYLKGLIKGTQIHTVAFTLPVGYRPPLPVYGMGVSNDNPCVVLINPDGNVWIITGNAAGWVSLNGISFSVAETKLEIRTPVLTNGWTSYELDFEKPGYYCDRGRVYLKGLIKGTKINTDAFTLPVGYRPSLTVYGMGVSDHTPCVVQIAPDGKVNIVTGTATGWVSLNGISFSVAEAKVDVRTPALTNGWSGYGGSFETPGYYIDRGRVYLKGLIKGTQIHTVAFTLPVGYRPLLPVYGVGVSNDNSCVVLINPDGNVWIVSGTATGWVSLNGISFRV